MEESKKTKKKKSPRKGTKAKGKSPRSPGKSKSVKKMVPEWELILQAKKPFLDQQFPPEARSLYTANTRLSQE